MIKSIDHIAIIVSSEESISFYKRLGFIETYRKERQHDTVVIMQLNDDKIEIFIDPNHPDRISNPESKGLRHLALKVDSIDTTLIELGVMDAQLDKDWTGENYCFISDPDGLPIELHE
jgi:glyoxylase I family protein